jgi:cell wall-associated NlpC family hydrolase
VAWSSEQLANARVIAQVGRQMGASQRDIQIALMTAMQESGLRNLRYGDRDSQGLFQQRPSQGWGTVAQVTDPTYASRKFYEALLKDSRRDSRSLTQAAQRVQRSAFPDAYAKHEGSAAKLLRELGVDGGVVSSQGAPATAAERQAQAAQQVQEPEPGFSTTAVGVQAVDAVGTQAVDKPVTQGQVAAIEIPQLTEGDPLLPSVTKETYNQVAAGGGAQGRAAEAIAFAKQFLGTPYKWGGSGPLGFDCSGLMQYVYRKVGVDLPRVSAQQAQAGQRIALDQLKPGDMVGWDNSSRNNGADHIGMYIGNGQVLHAPRPGDRVKISSLWDTERAWGVRMNL